MVAVRQMLFDRSLLDIVGGDGKWRMVQWGAVAEEKAVRRKRV